MFDDNTNYFEVFSQLFFGIMGIEFKNGSILYVNRTGIIFSFSLTIHEDNIMKSVF
jgi:hypothetical protein